MPLMIYNVQQQSRYRFRLINAASNVCSFILKIENHNFTVIASDGQNLKPKVVNTLHFTSGERYDFVVHTDQEPKDYAIHIKAHEPCTRFNAYAVLRYQKNWNSKTPTELDFVDMEKLVQPDPEIDENTFNVPHPSLPGTLISEAESANAAQSPSKSDNEFNLFLGTPQVDNKILFESVNTIKFMGKVKIRFVTMKNTFLTVNHCSDINEIKL